MGEICARKLDFAVCRLTSGFDRSWFDYLPIGPEDLLLVASVNNLLGGSRRFVEAEDLNDCNWVLQPPGSAIRQVVDDFHQKHAIFPKSVISTASVLLTLQSVRLSDRIGIFGASTARMFENSGMIKSLSMSAEIGLPDYGLVKLRNQQLSPAGEVVYRSVLARAEQSSLV